MRVQELLLPSCTELYFHLSFSSGSVASGWKWWLMIACLSGPTGTFSCTLSATTKSFGPACWRKPMPSKDGSTPRPGPWCWPCLTSCFSWHMLPPSWPWDLEQLCWMQAMPLGASEPLPPSLASSLNNRCVQSCVQVVGRDPEALSKGWARQGWREICTDNGITARAGMRAQIKYNIMDIFSWECTGKKIILTFALTESG